MFFCLSYEYSFHSFPFMLLPMQLKVNIVFIYIKGGVTGVTIEIYNK